MIKKYTTLYYFSLKMLSVQFFFCDNKKCKNLSSINNNIQMFNGSDLIVRF